MKKILILIFVLSGFLGNAQMFKIDQYNNNPSGPSLGPEKTTNGSFDTDTSWTKRNGTTISGGSANVIGAGNISFTGTNHVLEQATGTTNGLSYTVEMRMKYVSGTGNVYIGQDFFIWVSTTITSTMTTYTYTGELANANANFTIGADSGTTIEVEFVSVKEEL